METIISVDNVSYAYEGEENDLALEGVSLDIKEGEFLAVLGRNGSGKSTLAKLLNALYRPTAGRVVVCGLDTSDEANTFDIRKSAGMVFQNPDNQLVATIVEEDVAFGLENLGLPQPEIRRRVDKALADVGMSAFAQSAPHLLSGGQKQRVAIAGIIAMQPRIIIMDEPTAMLDPVGRRDVAEAIAMLNRDMHITVVLITHFMEEAARADRIAVIDSGKLVMTGTPREVFSHAEDMRALGLDVPLPTELASRLRARGWDIRGDILTADELKEELCRFL